MKDTDLSPVSESPVPGSSRLYLFFGGIMGALGMPPFEFYRASRVLGYSRIFLRDPAQAWYQRGLPGIGADARAVGEFLRRKIDESGASDVYFVGNSMGGYAALMFCALLRRGQAVAFAPQTFVSRDKRRQHGDGRWARQIAALHGARTNGDILELAGWIRDNHPAMRARIYVSSLDALDLRHVDELSGFPNIEIHRFPGAGHALVRQLRDDGELARILNS